MMRAGMTAPIWFNEFTAGGGGYYGTPNRSRMWAHFGLLLGAQAVMPWTWHSHHGGEEQALFGLIDHDDRPSWKLDEFATIAREFATLEKLGFPRLQQPEVAIAYAFDNIVASAPPQASNTVLAYIKPGPLKQAQEAYAPLFRDNIDVAVINIGHEDLRRYKLVVVAGMYLLDHASTENLRRYVAGGGTVVMTAQSAKVDDHDQWHDTSLPGGLTDVFGLRTNAFYDAGVLHTALGGDDIKLDHGFYEVLEPSTAEVLARFSDVEGRTPAVTVNRFGKGRAIYVAATAQASLMRPLYRQLYASLGLQPGPRTPDGVVARAVDGRVLYVNTTGQARDVPIDGAMTGVLSGKRWTGTLRLEPLGVDLLEPGG
jgi:beta-galactosidase